MKKSKNCKKCGNKFISDKKHCNKCLMMYRIRDRKRMEMGLCRTCCKNKPEFGKTMCLKCLDKKNIANKNLYKLRKSLGVCRNGCGKKVYINHLYCKECLIKSNEYGRKQYKKNIDNDLCPRCRVRKILNNKQSCKECLWDGILRKNYITFKEADKLLKQQNYICPLSGRKLIKGVNASIDHIIPIGKHRKDKNHKLAKVSNIRIVDIDVQFWRRNFTDQKIIKVSEDITKHNK